MCVSSVFFALLEYMSIYTVYGGIGANDDECQCQSNTPSNGERMDYEKLPNSDGPEVAYRSHHAVMIVSGVVTTLRDVLIKTQRRSHNQQ